MGPNPIGYAAIWHAVFMSGPAARACNRDVMGMIASVRNGFGLPTSGAVTALVSAVIVLVPAVVEGIRQLDIVIVIPTNCRSCGVAVGN